MIAFKGHTSMRFPFLFASAAIALIAQAPQAKAQQAVETSQAWSRATPAAAPVGVGFLTLNNRGAEADRLLGGSSDVAARVEVHEMNMDNGVMKMREVSGGLEVKPGETRELKPGGYHLMLLGLKRPLKEGERFNIRLNFAKSGAKEVEFTVQGVGAAAPPMQHNHH